MEGEMKGQGDGIMLLIGETFINVSGFTFNYGGNQIIIFCTFDKCSTNTQ